MTDEHPELAGYEPGNERPLRDPRVLFAMRALVLLGIVGLILPGVLTTVAVGTETARRACTAWVARVLPNAAGGEARFELFGPGGVGWQCYSVGAFGGDEIVVSLGLIPSGARLDVAP